MIERLRSELPGLSAAVGGRLIDWRAVEAGIGFALPSDYKQLSASFPTFSIDEFILVSTPRPGGENEFIDEVNLAREILGDDVAEGDIPSEYLVSEGDGDVAALLQWGGTPDGDEILWCTADASPDEWPVVFRGRSGGWWSYRETAVTFLEGIYSGRLRVPGLPRSLASKPREISFLSF